MNLRFYLLVSGVHQVESEREVSPRFSFVIPEVWKLPLSATSNEMVSFSVFGVFADD